MDLVKFLLGCLAVWRITHLLVAEEGPWAMFSRLRTWAMGQFLGGILSCFYCASVWVAAAVAVMLGGGVTHILLSIAGYSGAAILLERTTAPNAVWVEESGNDTPTNDSQSVLRSGDNDTILSDDNAPTQFTHPDRGSGINAGGSPTDGFNGPQAQ